eukprot:TRINITY_DN3718_c1_g1_i1.p1 TRINITY_DN3718_c1_g1~~TRINITY_DN3718_c1_g1_i1.p1  ORF type:complete len:464 (-),score=98.66 TRINITY_DN3718_c1_g1_i1:137-1483(-)
MGVHHLRHRVSSFLIPRPRIIPHNSQVLQERGEERRLSRSHRLLVESGFIHQEHSGYFTLLPLGLRCLRKLEALVEESLEPYGCQRLRLPTLSPYSHWKTSGRNQDMGEELLSCKNRRGKTFVLSPTHEESISHFFSTLHPSYKSLPLYLYQITFKYRDELNPKFGLLRANEFLMKDLYTFDPDEASANRTYEAINEAYNAFFKRLEVPFVRVAGSGASMGSEDSHEYHYLVGSSGQDQLGRCDSCGTEFNMELINHGRSACIVCDGGTVIPHRDKAIEIAHTFKLGDKYSSIFKAYYTDKSGMKRNPVMCCFGIGLTRLLAASAEALSSESSLRWPKALAPFRVAVVLPKTGSKEFPEASSRAIKMTSNALDFLSNDVLVDDSEGKSIGAKIRDMKALGIPIILVFGKSSIRPVDPFLEIHTYDDEVIQIPEVNVKDFISKYFDLHP